MKLGVMWIYKKWSLSRENTLVGLKLIIQRVIKLIFTIYHLFHSHYRVHNIGVLHADGTKVADQLIISACLIKFLQCLGVLGPQNNASGCCCRSVLLLKTVPVARSATRGVADL